MEDANLLEHMQTAWNIVNDSYYSDVCLQHPPHLVALAVIYIIGITQSNVEVTPPSTPAVPNNPLLPFVVPKQQQPEKLDVRIRKWFNNLNVHMKPVCNLVINII